MVRVRVRVRVSGEGQQPHQCRVDVHELHKRLGADDVMRHGGPRVMVSGRIPSVLPSGEPVEQALRLAVRQPRRPDHERHACGKLHIGVLGPKPAW